MTTTWADGFGVWHAKVPAQPHRHEMTAYQAIRKELEARQGAPLPAFGLAVVSEDAETITYRESWDTPHSPTMAELAQAVIDHATKHYEEGGWDVVVECMTVEDIVGGWEASDNPAPTTVEEAVATFAAPVSVWADRQADARNSAF